MQTLRMRISVVLFIALPFGCAAPLTPIGPGNLYEPDEGERRLWDNSRDLERHIIGSGKLHDDAELQDYVQSVLERVIGDNLSAYAPLKPRVYIVDSTASSAFSLAPGAIMLHTGVLGRIRSEAQLALLLGHEITHSTHRHMYQRQEDRYARTGFHAYISVISAAGGSNLQNLVSGMSDLITTAAIKGYSRKQEREADRVGLILIAQAGYDPNEGAKLFSQMLEATDESQSGPVFLYASHPKMKNRVRSCHELIPRLPPELLEQAMEVGQARFLEHASGMIHLEARTQIAQGKFGLAIRTLKFMSEAREQDAEVRALLGDLYRARGEEKDRRKATIAYTEAIECDDENPRAHRGLGLLLMGSNDEEASNHLRRYLDLQPDANDAPYMLQYLSETSEDE